jgi:hypothetical protein
MRRILWENHNGVGANFNAICSRKQSQARLRSRFDWMGYIVPVVLTKAGKNHMFETANLGD